MFPTVTEMTFREARLDAIASPLPTVDLIPRRRNVSDNTTGNATALAGTDAAATAQQRDEFRYVLATDELAQPLLAELEIEYDTRYGDFFGAAAAAEMNRYPASDFAEPNGAFVVLLREGIPVAGGAFKRFNEDTAEFKRIWTAATHRRQGLARLVLAELEAEASRRGYSRVYLTTGPRQPEAKNLYLATDYTALFDVNAPADTVGIHAFEKELSATLGPAASS